VYILKKVHYAYEGMLMCRANGRYYPHRCCLYYEEFII